MLCVMQASQLSLPLPQPIIDIVSNCSLVLASMVPHVWSVVAACTDRRKARRWSESCFLLKPINPSVDGAVRVQAEELMVGEAGLPRMLRRQE